MQTFCYQISGCDDFELNRNRAHPLKYQLTLPEGESAGLVIYVPGFGHDKGDYLTKFRRYVADRYGLACLTAEYHAIHTRPADGVGLHLEQDDLRYLYALLKAYQVDLQANETLEQRLHALSQKLASIGQTETLPATLIPANDGYQNFGVMAAVDCLLALADALQRHKIDKSNIIAIGSSYGGYVANLMAKFAPNTFRAVFDNSSWAEPNLSFVIGRDINSAEYFHGHSEHLLFSCFVRSAWTNKALMPNEYCADRQMIRSFCADHIAQMARQGNVKTQFRYFHAPDDRIANTDAKIEMAKALIAQGFDVQMTIAEEADVDGRFIKNLDHGLGLSMRTFFDLCYSHIGDRSEQDDQTDFDFDHEVNYVGALISYRFIYEQGGLVCMTQHQH